MAADRSMSQRQMSQRKRYVIATVMACLGLSYLGGYGGNHDNGADGWLFDASLWARAQIRSEDLPAQDKVAIIAVDQRSLDSTELKDLPRALFAPVWARTLQGLRDAGARAVAFEFLLTFSGGTFKAGYDRTFQQALFRQQSLAVLGRTAATLPAKSYQAALRFDADALGMLELIPDQDGVMRVFPLIHETGSSAGSGAGLRSLSARALERA